MRTRQLRRLLALLLCFALCAGVPVQAYQSVSGWAKPEVEAAEALGIIPSSLKDAALSDAMTRLDLCRMAVNTFERIVGCTLYPAKLSHFTDTRDTDVCVAFELGLVSGYPDGTFRPTKQITRQEFARIVQNLLTILGWTEREQILFAFADEAKVALWAREATARMVTLGIVTGDSKKCLNPTSQTSAEQACAMFLRAYHLLAGEGSGGICGPAESISGAQDYCSVSDWAYETVEEADLLGILPASVLEKPMNGPISRSAMCEMAVATYALILGQSPEAGEAAFSDTDLPAVLQANALGLVSGYPDGSFRPDEALTRQQFFQITNNFFAACGRDEADDAAQLAQTYADAARIADWAQSPVALLYRMDILHGDNAGNMNPAASTTCEQAIAMLMRTYRQVSPWCSAHPLEQIVGPLTSLSEAQQVVELAKSMVGKPYVWAGANPSVGFDCSGLVYYVYGQLGYRIGRSGADQVRSGIAVQESSMLPGDIIIFANASSGAIQHVGLYIGDGLMVHAQSSRTGVVISPYDYDTGKYIYAIRRIIY